MAPRSQSILTPMQWLVLERLARGESVEAIAQALGIAPGTVKIHLNGIYQRLSLGRPKGKRAAAIAWYLREGQQRHQQEEGSGVPEA